MLQYVRRGQLKTVGTLKLDRQRRSLAQTGLILKEMNTRVVPLNVANQGLDHLQTQSSGTNCS